MYKFIFLLLVSILSACTGTKQVVEAPVEDLVEERLLDTMMVVAPKITEADSTIVLEKYNPAASRTIDLLHTKLDLKFNWEKQHVLGTANLKLKPYFYPSSKVELDAVGFDIHEVTNVATGYPLAYDYDGFKIKIALDKVYTKMDEANILIKYTAKPDELPEGGSAAITSDKGLFFINPLGEDPDKPMQIWTQGETENNSRWFPTVDKPNERCTQETIVTVDKKFATLSNGKLISSKDNSDGTRTDVWSMEQPHAPYLFMLAIGEFAVVKDKWKDIPVNYYVEPEYEEDAVEIFNHTPEMLSFFSEYVGVEYPWDKYSQVVVRDYVSGAMENTTAVIYGDFVQKTKRELIDNHNDYIVAHEMFHHWFGDYVTCESWSNLTLNEGFANYSEYLWTEHKYGKEAADRQRFSELRGYLNSAQNQGTHDLIDYGFDDKEQMFDAHSYNKGGLVLHMLRNYVGDDAFRAALNKYLVDNAYTAVEAHELRMAFEDVTGEDLNWFFNQWYFDKGHPELDIIHAYTDGQYTLKVTQTQDLESNAAIFQLPLAVDIYMADGSKKREKIWIDQRSQTIVFEVAEKPAFVNFDADNILLGVRNEDLSVEENIFQYANSEKYQDRVDALNDLRGEPKAKTTFIKALDDSFFSLRRIAIDQINPSSQELIEKLKDMAVNDPKSQVRSGALDKLAEVNDPALIDFAEEVIQKEQAYGALAAGIHLLNQQDNEKGLKVAEEMMGENNYEIVSQLSEMFANSGDSKYISFFEDKIANLQGFNAYPVFGSYFTFLQNLKPEEILNNMDFLVNTGKSNSSNFKRFMATNSLNNLKQVIGGQLSSSTDEDQKGKLEAVIEKADQAIQEIIKVEKNPQLLMRYQGFTKA